MYVSGQNIYKLHAQDLYIRALSEQKQESIATPVISV